MRNDMLIDVSETSPGHRIQEELQEELDVFEGLLILDRQYCVMVEGVAQETGLWVARNDTILTDNDLQRFKMIAWNHCVVKKFLEGREGTAESLGQSMIDIIQNLNLQWRRMQVMGLHAKVEAAERQVVMHCMNKALIPFDHDVGRICRVFRRCGHFREFFANAVGAQVVANAGRTPGLVKTQYGTDMDYAYKNRNLSFFENALFRDAAHLIKCMEAVDDTDYVEALSRFRIVRKNEEYLNHTEHFDRKAGPNVVVQNNADTKDLLESKIELINEKMEAFKTQTQKELEVITSQVLTRIEQRLNSIEQNLRQNRLATVQGILNTTTSVLPAGSVASQPAVSPPANASVPIFENNAQVEQNTHYHRVEKRPRALDFTGFF